MTKTQALENCRLIAAREIHRHDTGRDDAALSYAGWKHIVRFCHEAGIEGSILRHNQSLGNSSIIADPTDRPRKSNRKPSMDEIENEATR